MRFSNNSLTRWLAVLLPAIALMLVIPAAHGKGKKKKKKEDEFTFEEDTSRAPPSKTLGRAAKLYDKGDYYSASIEFHKVISKQTKDTKANHQSHQLHHFCHLPSPAASDRGLDCLLNAFREESVLYFRLYNSHHKEYSYRLITAE